MGQLRGKKGRTCAFCFPKSPKTPPEVAAKLAAVPKSKAKPKAKSKTKPAPKPETDYPETITALNSMKKGELVELAEELGSSTKGLKDDLVKRLAKKLKIK
jgi:hypothetical protein